MDDDVKNKLREWLDPDLEKYSKLTDEQREQIGRLIDERRSERGRAKTEGLFNRNFEGADANSDGLNFEEFLEFSEAYKV